MHPCVKRIFFPLVALLLPAMVSAQQWKKTRTEVMLGLGAANILGDLGGADQIGTHLMKDLELSLTKPAVSIGYRYKLSPTMALRSYTSWMQLAGNDQLTAEPARNNRNLSFRSNVFETFATFEFSIIEEKLKGRYAKRGKKFPLNVYVYGGVGFFYFNPKAQLDGKWYALKPLGTEGQGLPDGPEEYQLVQITVPLGIGLKYPINKEWSVGLEYCLRTTFTDYIDDVSTVYYDRDAIRAARGDLAYYFADPTTNKIEGGTNPGQKRGDADYNDSYLTAQLFVSYKITRASKSRVKF